MVGKLASEIRFKRDERKLSARETQILEVIREGLTNAEIAKRLSVEESTIKTHIHHLLGKLHVKNRTEATFFARRHLI
jgi:DNA-binding NarL/FixJ family response regulator